MRRARKVGVLTFHRCINYGSYWQARCLVEGLSARGDEARLLDHASARVTRREWRCALNPTLPTPTAREDVPAYRAKTRKFLEAFEALPLSKPFDLDRPEAMEPFDLGVVGSDEVWNLRHPWYAGYPLFFGEGLKADRLVAYAASCGVLGADERLDPCWAERLRNFAAISVRDDTSRVVVEAALGRTPAMALDPCLQFDIGQARPHDGGDYLALYGHNFSPGFQAAVRAWARARGVAIVSLGYRNDWADEQRIEAGPEEFADVIGGAQAVATNFFHGCVFALLNGKPLAAESSGYRRNKVRSLLDMAGVSDRLVEPDAEPSVVAELLDRPPGEAAARRLDGERTATRGFLDHALA